MKNKGERQVLHNITIEDIGAEGKAVARVENIVLFVPFGIPGDVCNVEVIRKRKKHMEGIITGITKLSPLRTDPHCSHFGTCGGCSWQHLMYAEQLRYKQKQVHDAMMRIGKLEIKEFRDILPSEMTKYYRNKLEYTFSDSRWLTKEEIQTEEKITRGNALGFHIPGRFDKVLDINECYHQPEPSNSIRLALKEYAMTNGLSFFNLREKKGFFRNVIIRNNLQGEFMVIVVFGENDPEKIKAVMDFLKEKFSQIHSLHYVVNTKANDTIHDLGIVHCGGENHIEEEMEGIRFRIGPKSFYQTNSRQAYNLYKLVRELASLQGNEFFYDLYTGTGTIALFLSGNCKKVIGIENVPDAVEDAKTNALLNHIENASFFAGDMKDVLTASFIETHGNPDVMCIDPPRAGMHESVIEVIRQAAPEKIVYVSCNPASQARDLGLLQDLYNLEIVRPVDMFPHTHHVENVALLKRK